VNVKHRQILGIGFAIAMMTASLPAFQGDKPADAALQPGHAAPDFAFADLTGARRKLSEFKGKVVLIDFWGTWCAPCVAALPKLHDAYDEFHARGFEILGVDASDKREKLDAFLKDRKVTWMQTMEEDDGPIATLFRVTGWPSYFLIDRDGRIAAAVRNGGDLDFKAEVAKLLPPK
jgi:peroxiredoxin